MIAQGKLKVHEETPSNSSTKLSVVGCTNNGRSQYIFASISHSSLFAGL